MKWIRASLYCCLVFFSATVFSLEVIDDVGTRLYSNKPINRIVSLAPDITEIIFAIGAGDKLIGVVSGSDYPLPAKKITLVGAYNGLDLERIVALHPDLIVTWGNTFSRQLNVLKKMGILVYTTQPKKLEDISRSMLNLGELVSTEKTAKVAAQNFNQKLNQLRKFYNNKKPITVFYQIGSYSLLTINKQSWINQVIELCGGRNVFADAFSITSEVSWETVIRANPAVIITDATEKNWQARWLKWTKMTAVKENLLFSISPDYIDRAGPRILEGVTLMCQHLQRAREKMTRQ